MNEPVSAAETIFQITRDIHDYNIWCKHVSDIAHHLHWVSQGAWYEYGTERGPILHKGTIRSKWWREYADKLRNNERFKKLRDLSKFRSGATE